MMKYLGQAPQLVRRARLTFLLIGVAAFAGCTSDPVTKATDRYTCDPDNGGLTLPEGFCAYVIIDSLGYARHMTVDEEGDVYVAMRARGEDPGGVAALRDTTGNGRIDVVERFGNYQGTGIELHEGYLYFGARDAILRFPLEPGELSPAAAAEMLVTGFPEQRTHAAKPFAFDNAGNLYVNVGAPSNVCREAGDSKMGIDPCPQLEQQAAIWRFSAVRSNQDFAADGYKYATGIRNALGLVWNHNTSALYATQHGRDMLYTLWGEYYTEAQSADLPAEEFFKVREGGNLGWPYCYYDQFLEKRIRAPEYGGDGQSEEGCTTYDSPLVTFPGHYGPNDLILVQGEHFPARYAGGALVAFHGSWNRRDARGQQGYQVAFIPADGDAFSTETEVFAAGFKGNAIIKSPGDAAHRPTGLAQGPDGSLYISDSVKGKIWRVLYRD
ncbi:MAG: PQQ-dependent sugar dehydrogenase [Bacteroidota bacterium]